MEINGKIALVTGGASGIGRSVAMELARRGVKLVALVDLTDEVGNAAEDIDRQAGRKVARGFRGDVTNSGFRREVYDVIGEEHGVVNVCVPAAGLTRDSLAVKMNKETGKAEIYALETFRFVTEVDLIAPIYWSLEMVARVAESRFKAGMRRWQPQEGIQGAIIFIGSISSQGNKGQIAYAAAKAGLEGAAATIMKEAIFYGVRCGVIHPGFTDTPMVRALGEEYISKHILPETQLGRLIRPQEIADAICFMITNSAVSGELWADAGWHPSPA
ncbi:MAG: SDR family NAD(P)-dependent oxidoreductase [Gammaproteobacteria bacterium]